MKIRLFTHVDLDGVGCAITMRTLFDEKDGHVVDVTYCDYDKINEKVQKFVNSKSNVDYDYLFITDISVDEDTADMLDDLNKSDEGPFVQLLDHHPTAEWLNKFEWAFVSSIERGRPNHKSSGTSLILDFFTYQRPGFERKPSVALNRFVEKVRRYDTWEWFTHYDDITAKELNDYLYMIGKEEFVNYILHNAVVGEDEELIYFDEKARALLDQKKKEIKAYIEKKSKQLTLIDTDDGVMGLVFADQHTSELGNNLCLRNPKMDYIALVDMGEQKISFRTTRNDLDLGKVAKKYGGGGHPKAAGASFDDEKVMDFLSELF